jgi:hypothetical protein
MIEFLLHFVKFSRTRVCVVLLGERFQRPFVLMLGKKTKEKGN